MGDKPKTYIANIADFQPDPQNANKHALRGRSLVDGSMRKRGYARPAFASSDNIVLGGNLSTLDVAVDIGLGDGKVLVIETDGTIPIIHKRTDITSGSEAARLLGYEDNRTGQLSLDWDPLQIVADLDAGLDLGSLWNDDEMAALLEAVGSELLKETGTEAEPQIDKAAELQEKWGTRLGQVWSLGEHILVCGDCTNIEAVEACLRGDVVDFYFTDPPYSVSYADKNKSLNAVSFGNRIQTPIENDHLSTEETAEKIWKPAFKNMFDVAKPGCVYYITAPQGGDQMMMMMMMMLAAHWLVKHELIWIKNNHVLGRADYHYKHEPILYGWKPGAGHYFVDDRSQVSVWEFDKPFNSDLHPTMKPVPLIEKAMSNSSRKGEVVADFFCGSGPTVLAAQNLGRRARCIEVDPGYTAVSIQRFLDATGIEPVLLSE